MKFIKKIGITTFGILAIFAINLGYCLKTGPVKESFNPETSGSPEVESKKIEDIDEGSHSFNESLKGVLQLPKKDHYETSLGYVIALIQIIINRLLGILAFIALVYMLYCGFLVLSSGSDDKNASSGKKGISTAAIALTGIGISWLIISAMIRFIKIISK